LFKLREEEWTERRVWHKYVPAKVRISAFIVLNNHEKGENHENEKTDLDVHPGAAGGSGH
jgi:ribosomal protein L11 methylase PrmA